MIRLNLIRWNIKVLCFLEVTFITRGNPPLKLNCQTVVINCKHISLIGWITHSKCDLLLGKPVSFVLFHIQIFFLLISLYRLLLSSWRGLHWKMCQENTSCWHSRWSRSNRICTDKAEEAKCFNDEIWIFPVSFPKWAYVNQRSLSMSIIS